MNGKRIGLGVAFPLATWLATGKLGLAVGVLIVLAWAAVRLRSPVLWAGAVVTMAAAPVALIVQGLPKGSIAGPGFASSHTAAHVLVGVSLALAGFAAMVEILGIDSPGESSFGARLRRAAAVLREKAQPPAGGVSPETHPSDAEDPEAPPRPSSGSPSPPPG